MEILLYCLYAVIQSIIAARRMLKLREINKGDIIVTVMIFSIIAPLVTVVGVLAVVFSLITYLVEL